MSVVAQFGSARRSDDESQVRILQPTITSSGRRSLRRFPKLAKMVSDGSVNQISSVVVADFNSRFQDLAENLLQSGLVPLGVRVEVKSHGRCSMTEPFWTF